MRKFTDKKKEMIFLIGGVVLTVFILGYLFLLINSLVRTAKNVYSQVPSETAGARYNFALYDELIGLPTSTPPEPATSTPATSTSEVDQQS